MPSYARWLKIQAEDVLLIETVAPNLDGFVNALELSYGDKPDGDGAEEAQAAADAAAMSEAVPAQDNQPSGDAASGATDSDKESAIEDGKKKRPSDLVLAEVVVRPGATIEGRTAAGVELHDHFGTWLIGLSREGRRVTNRVRHMNLRAGDVLLLMGPDDRLK